MRIAHATTACALVLLLHGAVAAPPAHRWTLAVPDVPHDPICAKLQQVIDDYFRRYPAMPDACVDAALRGAFSEPAWQLLPDPSRDFVAQLEKYMQVGPNVFFVEQDARVPVEDTYYYRADLFKKVGGKLFIWKGEMGEQFTHSVTLPGKFKTILQSRLPRSMGGCDGKPDQQYVSSLILMNPDASVPIRMANRSPASLLFGASLRLYGSIPVVINGATVYKQDPVGFQPMCQFEKLHK